MVAIPSDYYTRLAAAESGGLGYLAKAATSSASGLFQLTKATATTLGLPWGSDTTQAFGGINISPEDQTAAIQKLTVNNANVLSNKGIDINSSNLYAAHFLGAGTAVRILGADDGASISSLVSPNVISANKFLNGMSVADFKNWLGKKMGDTSIPQTVGGLVNSGAQTLNDIGAAATTAVGNVGNAVSGAVGDAANAVGGVVKAGTDAVGGFTKQVGDFFNFLTHDLFTINTGARIVLVIIGVLLISAAVWAFMADGGAKKLSLNVVPIPV